MPTAGKLIGAALMAALTLLISTQIATIMDAEEAGNPGLMVPINTLFGVLLGWRILGPRVGDAYRSSAGYALTTIIAIFLCCLVLWSAVEMLDLATRSRYDGPTEALGGMGGIMLDYAILAAKPMVVGTMLIGSYIVGIVTEYFARRWS